MRFRKVYNIVFRKEFRELLRDKRSLFWLFAPPIILPGIAICAGIFIGSQVLRIAGEGFPIIIENGAEAPELVDRFGEAVMIVSIPEDFQEQLAETGNSSIQLLTKDDSIISFFGKSAVKGIIDDYSQDLLDERLTEMGVTRDWLNPIAIGERRVSATAAVTNEVEDEEEGRSLLATIFLPLAVTSWLLGGGMGLILDTTVGEKERQTIENLLVTPASRIGIVMGKMTVVFLASMLVMSLWLMEGLLLNAFTVAGPELAEAENLSMGEAIKTVLNSGDGIFSLVGALVLLIVPFTILLNGLMMSWCAYAANYREANLFMALIQLGLPASVLLTIFSLPPDVPEFIYAVPFFGTIVAIRDLFSNALPTVGLIVNVISGIFYAAGGVWLAAWIFGREWSLTRGLQ
jgi:sodium transport system permease protein